MALSALLVVLAGLAFAVPALTPVGYSSPFPLLAAGCALLVAGLLILRPAMRPPLRALIGFEQGVVILVLALASFAAGQASLPAGLSVPLLVVTVLVAAVLTPANPLTPFTAASSPAKPWSRRISLLRGAAHSS